MRTICLGLLLFIAGAISAPAQNHVVLIRAPDVVTGLRVEPVHVRAMLAAGLRQLTGQTNDAAAWQQIASSNDVVGIKVCTLAGPAHVTHQDLLDAIAAGLRQAGVAATNIVVFDRDPKKLAEAEYRANGFRIEPVIEGAGWDASAFVENPLVGKLIWGDLDFNQQEPLSTRSHLPVLVTQRITKLINVPVLMDHEATGLAGCLYNLSLGMADNVRRLEQFGQRGDPVIAELCALPAIRQKLVLNICDALLAGYAGGPAFKPKYAWPYGGLYLSQDPVAVDMLCLSVLEAKRQEEHLPAIGTRASHILTAAHMGLGQTNATLTEVTR